MPRKKKEQGTEKADASKPAPRRTVSLPLTWFEVAEKLAAKGPTPIVWYLVKLIEKDAEANGMTDLPPPPWKTEEK